MIIHLFLSSSDFCCRHSCLVYEKAVASNAVECEWIGIDPYVAVPPFGCEKLKIPTFAPDLNVAKILAKVTWKDFCQCVVSVSFELALGFDDFCLSWAVQTEQRQDR